MVLKFAMPRGLGRSYLMGGADAVKQPEGRGEGCRKAITS